MLHFAPRSLHIVISPHTYAFARSHVRGAGVGDPKGKSGPQVPCVMDANIVVIKASPGATHKSPLAVLSIFIIMFCLIVHLSL
jgi:hypothetical protein